MRYVFIVICLFYISCSDIDTFHMKDTKLSKYESLLLSARMKQAHDECQYPSSTCNGDILQTCTIDIPVNHYIDVQDCTATGLTCWFYARDAECR